MSGIAYYWSCIGKGLRLQQVSSSKLDLFCLLRRDPLMISLPMKSLHRARSPQPWQWASLLIMRWPNSALISLYCGDTVVEW